MARRKQQSAVSGNDHYKAFIRLIKEAAVRHDTYTVFRDFCEMAAISMSNAVDLGQAEAREAEYMLLAAKHKDKLSLFPEMLGELTMAHEMETADHLGSAFHELELHNKWMGQYFTPYNVCLMMAKMQAADGLNDLIEQRGFIRANEPACGSGAMMIALCQTMKEEGINYQQNLHVVAQDLDIRSVHMTYIQLSLLHCPAVVIQGDSLALEERSHWYTPAHILGLWGHKLRRRSEEEARYRPSEAWSEAPPPAAPEPVPEPIVEPILVPVPAMLFDAPQVARTPPARGRKPAADPKPATGQFTLF